MKSVPSKIARILAMSLVFVGTSFPMTARAINIPQIPFLNILPLLPPLPLPDICLSFVGCPVQFTNMTFVMDLQRYRALVQNVANINNIGGLQGAVEEVVGIVAAAEAAPAMKQGNVAAETTINNEADTQTRIANVDNQAANADGVQQQAQVANAYQSTIAGEINKTNVLLAEGQHQRHEEIDGIGQAVVDLFNGDATIPNGL